MSLDDSEELSFCGYFSIAAGMPRPESFQNVFVLTVDVWSIVVHPG